MKKLQLLEYISSLYASYISFIFKYKCVDKEFETYFKCFVIYLSFHLSMLDWSKILLIHGLKTLLTLFLLLVGLICKRMYSRNELLLMQIYLTCNMHQKNHLEKWVKWNHFEIHIYIFELSYYVSHRTYL